MELLSLSIGPARRAIFFTSALLLAMSSAGCENTVEVEGGGGAGGGIICDDEEGCTCDGLPVCEVYEIEVETCAGSVALSCREVSVCGQSIFCEEPETCTAVPVCDEGDDEVPACPNDGSPCYQVELCGGVISCIDNGLPHGCPPTPPASQEACTDLDLVCNYPLENGCFESWSCIDPNAAPPPGGAPDGGGEGAADEPIAPYVWQLNGTACPDGAA